MSHHWWHFLHHAKHASDHGQNKIAGVILLIVGFFLAPMLIGIPLMLFGAYKLLK